MNVPVGRRTALVVGTYAVLVVGLLGILPFWLDEVLQLVGTHPGATASELLRYIPQNPGGVPLGYFVQHWTLEVLGLSRWSARLPSAVFGVAACLATGLLARRMGAGSPWIAAGLFALTPSMLRYSTEGRPYSMGVFLSVAATLLFLRVDRQRTLQATLLYGAALLAGIFTQPFTILCGGAHGIWAVLRRDWRLAARVAVCGLLAVLAFVPWMIWSRRAWDETIESSRFAFVWDWRTPLMLFREIPSVGYVGAAALLLLAVAGWRSNRGLAAERTLLALLIAVPLAGGLAADALFSYFIASRQFLWILPPALVLASAGLIALGRYGVAAAAIFALASGAKSAKYYSSPVEDWEQATRAIAQEVAKGGCLAVAPPASAYIYEFIDPVLRGRRCGPDSADARRVIAVPPYSSREEEQRAVAGSQVEGVISSGGTRILLTRHE